MLHVVEMGASEMMTVLSFSRSFSSCFQFLQLMYSYLSLFYSELSMGWVDPRVGLGWVGSGWVEIFSFLVGWVGSWVGKIPQNSKTRYTLYL